MSVERPLVPLYSDPTRKLAVRMRMSEAQRKANRRINRLEMLLARAYYALNDAHVMAYNPPLLIDIKEALEGKRGRHGPKTIGHGEYRRLE